MDIYFTQTGYIHDTARLNITIVFSSYILVIYVYCSVLCVANLILCDNAAYRRKCLLHKLFFCRLYAVHIQRYLFQRTSLQCSRKRTHLILLT